MKVEICNIGTISSSIIVKELTQEQFEFLNKIFEELNNEGGMYSPTIRVWELVNDDERTYLKWVDMETNETHCYNCCLWDWDNVKCKNPKICKNIRETYRGYFTKIDCDLTKEFKED